MAVAAHINPHCQLLFRIEACEATTTMHFPWNQVVETEIELTSATGARTKPRFAAPVCRLGACLISEQCRRRQKTCARPAGHDPERDQPSW